MRNQIFLSVVVACVLCLSIVVCFSQDKEKSRSEPAKPIESETKRAKVVVEFTPPPKKSRASLAPEFEALATKDLGEVSGITQDGRIVLLVDPIQLNNLKSSKRVKSVSLEVPAKYYGFSSFGVAISSLSDDPMEDKELASYREIGEVYNVRRLFKTFDIEPKDGKIDHGFLSKLFKALPNGASATANVATYQIEKQ